MDTGMDNQMPYNYIYYVLVYLRGNYREILTI